METEVLVLGAGPGGYPAAIRAAQLGKQVIIVDKGGVGGECLNYGCIPSKALISASSMYYKMINKVGVMGISASDVNIDISTMMEWKEGIQNKLIKGIKQLLKVNKIRLISGTASFMDSDKVNIRLEDGKEEEIEFEHVIIATGTSFISLPGFEIDEEKILSAKGVLSLSKIPEKLVVIGGGIIGLELGTVWAKLGSKVTVIELLPQLMTGVSKRVVNQVKMNLKKLGVSIYTSAKATGYQEVDGKLLLDVDTGKELIKVSTDKILLSVGKKASTKDLDLTKAGVESDERGFIIVNDKLQTNISNIYAVGDCTGMPFLAHKATKQGVFAAEVIAGEEGHTSFDYIPSAIFTDPEIGLVGMSEEEAKEKGIEVIVGKASFGTSGRAMSQLEASGFVRIISEASTSKILGVEIVGPHASDLISEAALAVQMRLTASELGAVIHPHPTLPEMIMEAAEAIEGKAIHVPNAKRPKLNS
jgi:dihydrolipoamide dehydrogenase